MDGFGSSTSGARGPGGPLWPAGVPPSDFVETAWWSEPWSRGCSMAHLPPAPARYGHLLRQPFGRVHWAGTETATSLTELSTGLSDWRAGGGFQIIKEFAGATHQ